MRALPLVLLMTFATIPFTAPASAEQICTFEGYPAQACVLDSASSDGGFCEEGGSEFAATRASVDAPGAANVNVAGESYCSGASGQDSVSLWVGTPVEGAGVTWARFHYEDPENGAFEQCFVSAGVVFQPVPCELAPPNPGWGNML